MENKDNYIGKLLDNRYEILEQIGNGGMAVVYKALCHRLNRNVAIKIMRDELSADEEFRNRFFAESHAVAMLSHPNIVAVYDVSHSDDVEYIVMELISGITLKQYIDKRGALVWKEAVHFSKQIAKALGHAHERGIIHRDIKPQNIMLLRDGTIKVADFGIAALENEIYESNGQAIGSVHYIAPEQARGEIPDSRSDIYSLGIVMYEMLTGKLPYVGDSLAEVAIKHMNTEPMNIRDINPDVPEELQRIVFRAMDPNLETRYKSAEELLADLDNFTRDMSRDSEDKPEEELNPVRSVSELSGESYRKRRRRATKVGFLTGSFALLSLIVVLIVFIWNYWLLDVFSPAERMNLPSFVGQNYAALTGNASIVTSYNFAVSYVIDTSVEEGTIVSQSPEAGRSVMKSPAGIDVTLTVSSGENIYSIPDVTNLEYREAILLLQKNGFQVEIENTVSEAVAKNHVVSTSPEAGKQLSSGSTVYVIISSGDEISYIEMPQLIGLTEDAARIKLEAYGLSYGGTQRVTDEVEPGTVISQSVPAFAQVEERTKILIQVSSGPVESGDGWTG